MTWVKVCGLRRQEEVEAAVDAGADAVGFVAVPGTPRFVDLERVASLASGVPVRRVLLTVDLSPEEVLDVVDRTGVDGLQPYGVNAVAAAAAAIAAGLMVLQPIRLGENGEASPVLAGAIPLFDARGRDRYGGTGETFDWGLLDGRRGDYVVAGGLGPDNVGDLVRRVRPWGVDASSRLESAPGVKDLGKVAAFVEEAKRT